MIHAALILENMLVNDFELLIFWSQKKTKKAKKKRKFKLIFDGFLLCVLWKKTWQLPTTLDKIWKSQKQNKKTKKTRKIKSVFTIAHLYVYFGGKAWKSVCTKFCIPKKERKLKKRKEKKRKLKFFIMDRCCVYFGDKLENYCANILESKKKRHKIDIFCRWVAYMWITLYTLKIRWIIIFYKTWTIKKFKEKENF